MTNLANVRNIGISAHIDSGKTTLTERILFYSGKIHKMGEVRGTGAVMDHMELEKEKGITITAACTTVHWNESTINIIDTPGHVDFTVEVERSLRVLDGAILVLCSVAGVQSQSITVDRQMKRYQTPRLAFINKLDRSGANPKSVIRQLHEKLGIHAVPLQIPIGLSNNLEGIVDLINMKGFYFDGDQGETVREAAIPEHLQDEAEEARAYMLDKLSLFSDEIMELMLEEKEIPVELIHKTLRKATLTQDLTPVLMGSAYRNKGVQLLLDAVERYLPNPLDRTMQANDGATGGKIDLTPDPSKPMIGMGFKLVDEPYGTVTYFRVYQGTARKGDQYYNTRIRKKQRFSRILRVHADQTAEIDQAIAGDIVAVVGIDSASGDTYCETDSPISLENMFVPEPVISLAVSPEKRADSDKLSKALQRFRKEDPTFRVGSDPETSETIISGMGELHLEIYLERIRREYGCAVQAGAPKVSYREAPTQECEYDYKHKKQTGGSGQYGHIKGRMLPLPEGEATQGESFIFENKVVQGRIPGEYIPSVEKGFRKAIVKGPVAGFEVVGLKCVLEDGSYHDVDSSDMAFQICALDCFREYFRQTKPVLLEPVMKVEIECPSEFQGTVGGEISSRRGMIMGSETREGFAVLTAEVPLANMFGYSTDLRSATQGKGTFSMEFARYARVPGSIQEEIVAKQKAADQAKK
ncbi:elongation factor G [bacterium]|nr:elongation factor G [bacterium]